MSGSPVPEIAPGIFRVADTRDISIVDDPAGPGGRTRIAVTEAGQVAE